MIESTYQIEVTKEQKRALAIAISCQICFVETGDVSMSAQSAVLVGRPDKIKALTEDQQDGLDKLRKLHALVLLAEPKQVRRVK
jgi:hypothetical protein